MAIWFSVIIIILSFIIILWEEKRTASYKFYSQTMFAIYV